MNGVTVLQLASSNNQHVCGYLLAANLLPLLVDLLAPLLTQQSEQDLSSALLSLLASLISTASLSPPPPLSLPAELIDAVR